MAKSKVEYTALMGQNYVWVGDILNGKDLTLADGHTSETASFRDGSTSNRLVLEGTGLKYDGDELTGGSITHIAFTTDGGFAYLDVTGKFDGDDIGRLIANKPVKNLFSYLFDDKETWIADSGQNQLYAGKGNDRIIGASGSDWIIGDAGNDRVTGKEGSDYFDLYKGSDKEIVTDFHASGGEGVQDYIYMSEALDYKIRKDGDDTIINLGHGDMMFLLGVPRSEIDISDFSFYS